MLYRVIVSSLYLAIALTYHRSVNRMTGACFLNWNVDNSHLKNLEVRAIRFCFSKTSLLYIKPVLIIVMRTLGVGSTNSKIRGCKSLGVSSAEYAEFSLYRYVYALVFYDE